MTDKNYAVIISNKRYPILKQLYIWFMPHGLWKSVRVQP